MKKIEKRNDYAKLVNNDAKQDTLNEFLTFKESFSPLLFDKLSQDFHLNVNSIFDPFVGTGSIFINEKLNYCFGEDVNPLSIAITTAKLKNIDLNETQNLIQSLKNREIDVEEFEMPNWPSFSMYVPQEKYNLVKSYIKSFENFSVFDYVNMVIICNLDKIFNFKHDGNGIKFRQSKIRLEELKDYLDNIVKKALQAKVAFQIKNITKNVSVFNKSSTLLNKAIKSVDVIITSPPYCNMFDYFEVYKIELWTSGLVKNVEEMRKLKKSALRSNLNANINDDFVSSNILSECLNILTANNCEAKKIKMINNYFYDMEKTLKNCYSYLNKNGYMFVVVGNSFYCSHPVKTDEILAEIAEQVGFKLEKILVARSLSTSSQQMKNISQEDRQFLRESILVLRRK